MHSLARRFQRDYKFLGVIHSTNATQSTRSVQSSPANFCCRNTPTQHLVNTVELTTHWSMRAMAAELGVSALPASCGASAPMA